MNRRIIGGVVVSSALLCSVTAGLLTSNLVYAAPTDVLPKTNSKENSKYLAEYSYKVSGSETGRAYESKKDDGNVILAMSGSVNFLKSTITKSGNGSKKTTDEGFNAAVLSIDSSKIKISDSTITTSGKYANAVFAYGDSTIDVSDSTIKTEKNNSSALTVTNEGTLISTNVTVETSGEDSVPIRFGDGGGEITVSEGKYTSQKTDGVLFDDDGMITVKNATFYTPKGDTFAVSGANAMINAEHVTLEYGNGNKQNFLRVEDGSVSLISSKNSIFGNIVVDKNSTASLRFTRHTLLEGSINASNSAKSIDVTLSKDSRIVLTDDNYVSRLLNEVSDNSNIFANGHKLFIGGQEAVINQGEAGAWEYDYVPDSPAPNEQEPENNKIELYVMLGAASFAFMVMLLITIRLANRNKRMKRKKIEQHAVEKAASNKMKKPWEKK